jgi:hypothetical protein
MAFRTNDRVKETSTTTGTGNLTLAGAVSKFQAFSVFANNDTFFYAVVHQTAAEWEIGIGTYVSATPALARTTVLESSNADAAVNFSAGTKDVFVTMPAKAALLLRELASAPAPTEADWILLHAFNGGVESQVRTKGEYGLIDVLSNRDLFRTRKQFYIGGLGSDTSAADDSMAIGIQIASHEGVWTVVATDADGQRKNMPTSATINTDAGLVGGFTQTRRDLNPDVTIKFKVISTTLRRVWIGWMEADHIASDTDATIHKFALRLSTAPAVTGFTIVHSNGTTETVEAQIQASDALTHTIRLIADEANARFGYSFDGAAVVWITTNIPAATASLGLQVQIRCLEAVAKNMDLWWVHGSMDK